MPTLLSVFKRKNKYVIPSHDKLLSIKDLSFPHFNNKISMEDKSNVSILIIDDEGYDSTPLLNLGYIDITINYKHTSLNSYKKYDIIFCDINNIAPELNNQGAELAKQIKNTYPEKTVVIFTGYNQNINITKYSKCVDYQIEKNADPSVLADIINSYISKKKDPTSWWKDYENNMRKNNVSNKEIALLEHFFVKSINEKSNYFDENILKYNKEEFTCKDIMDYIASIGNFVIFAIQLIGSIA